MEIAYSVNKIPIRLTYERWFHIIENHDDMASYFYEILETIEQPNFVIKGSKGTLKAARNYGKNHWLVVIYREVTRIDGFVMTGYFLDERPKGEIIWRQH